MLKFLICRAGLNGNCNVWNRNEADCRFAKGHSGSVTFVGMDKLNKTLVSAGSDGLILVLISELIANCSYGISRIPR